MTATIFELPLSPEAQNFIIQLGATTYTVDIYWNDDVNGKCWMLDISDSAGNPIVQGIPIITGADLLAQYAYLDFTGQLIAQTATDPDAVPTNTNLGINGNVFYVAAA